LQRLRWFSWELPSLCLNSIPIMPSPPFFHLLPDLITYFHVLFVLASVLPPLLQDDKYLLISYIFFRSGVGVVNVQATNVEDGKIYIKIVGFLLKLRTFSGLSSWGLLKHGWLISLLYLLMVYGFLVVKFTILKSWVVVSRLVLFL